MFFYGGLLLTIILFFYFSITLLLLYIRRKMATDSWNELINIWRVRYELVMKFTEYIEDYIKDKKALHDVLQIKNECCVATKQEELIEANIRLGKEYNQLMSFVLNMHNFDDDTEFDNLHQEFVSIEEKLAFAWRFYCEYTSSYNRIVSNFPTNIVAKLFNFRTKKQFNLMHPSSKW